MRSPSRPHDLLEALSYSVYRHACTRVWCRAPTSLELTRVRPIHARSAPPSQAALSNLQISVFVRKRPMLPFEMKAGAFDVVTPSSRDVGPSLVVHEPKTPAGRSWQGIRVSRARIFFLGLCFHSLETVKTPHFFLRTVFSQPRDCENTIFFSSECVFTASRL